MVRGQKKSPGMLLTALYIPFCFSTKPWLSSLVSAALATFCDLVGGMVEIEAGERDGGEWCQAKIRMGAQCLFRW
jgi:hypothetical protein